MENEREAVKIKRFIYLLAVLLSLTFNFAAAEPLSFGVVNTNQTNCREKIGGDIAFRLDKEALVYIAGRQTDG